MRLVIREKVESLLQRIEVLNKRLDDRVLKGISTEADVRAVSSETIKIVKKINEYISTE